MGGGEGSLDHFITFVFNVNVNHKAEICMYSGVSTVYKKIDYCNDDHFQLSRQNLRTHQIPLQKTIKLTEHS